MAEADVNQIIPIDVFAQNFHQLQMELRAQGLAQKVRNFSGEGAQRFRDWLLDMEKAGAAIGRDPERMKILCLQTLTGTASEFVCRYLRIHPECTWQTLRTALRGRYSDLSDQQHAQLTLKKLKQRTGESVQNFSDRILNVAEEAFVDDDLLEPLIQAQLREVFTDGVRDDRIARKLLEKKPATLDAAVEIAAREQQTSRTFAMRRKGEEPMEVDAIQSNPRLARLEGEVSSLSSSLKQVLSIVSKGAGSHSPKGHGRGQPWKGGNHPNQHEGRGHGQGQLQRKPTDQTKVGYTDNTSSDFQQSLKWASDGKPICSYCDRYGHVKRKCRVYLATLNNQKN